MYMSQSTFISERTNVRSALWRKKIDNTFFRYKGTAIPKWVLKSWNLEKYFPDKNGFLRKTEKRSEVKIEFNKIKYTANVTCTHPPKRADKVYRLWFNDDLLDELKVTFNMSYMRDLESSLRQDMTNIEKEIPFWEFIDIEFIEDKLKFIFTAHYKQESFFPELFNRLSGSPAVKSVEDEIFGKSGFRIHKQDWREIKELETEIGAFNVIYYLISNKKKEIYIGEAKDLIKRLRQHFKINKDWDYYRYDKLPSFINTNSRINIERMIIRSYASLFENKAGVINFKISNFTLKNSKIDK
jgi:hypothetical protein